MSTARFLAERYGVDELEALLRHNRKLAGHLAAERMPTDIQACIAKTLDRQRADYETAIAIKKGTK